MILDSTTKSLQFVLSSTVAASPLTCVASWADISGSTFTPGSATSQTNNTTAATIVASPASSVQRQVKSIDIFNADTAPATVKVIYNDNATMRTLAKITLQPAETLQFAENAWSVIDSGGRAQTSGGSDSLAGDTDVLISSPSNGQVLTYQSSTGKWINGAGSGGGGVTGGAWQFSVEAYGAVGDGKMVNDVVTNNSTTITSASANWTSADVGKHIMINGGLGNSNIPLITTITAVASATSATLANAATASSSNLPAVWGTDDTTAIRNAIEAGKTYALAHEYYSEIVFKDKFYILAAAPQQSTNPYYNTQLKVPAYTADSDYKLTTAFKGVGKNDHLQYWGSTLPGILGTCLISMQTAPSTIDATYGPQSVLGGPTGYGGFPTFGGIGSFPNVKAVVENISIVAPAYTNLTAFDLSWVSGCYVDGSSAHIFAQPFSGGGVKASALLADSVFQSRAGVGLRTPAVGNNADVTIPSFASEGYTVGISASEHVWIGNLKTIYNHTAFMVTAQGIAPPGHGVTISRWTAEAYNGGIKTDGNGTCPINVNLSTEFSGSSFDVQDDGNQLRGQLNFWAGVDNRGPVIQGGRWLTVVNNTFNATQLGGSITPRVVQVLDGATITIDVSGGNDFRVVLGGNRTLAAPTHPSDGQQIVLMVGQDNTGGRTLNFSTSGAFDFGAGGAPTLSTAAHALDALRFVYNGTINKWLYLGGTFGLTGTSGGGGATATGETVFGQPTTGMPTLAADSSSYTMGMQFSLSASAALTGIWFYSPTGAGALPTACAIYTVTGTSAVTGTINTAPTWSGAAGSGWVKCAYDGSVSLNSSTNYKVAVQYSGGSNWYGATSHYWDTGAGASGLTSSGGKITAPSNSGTASGQDSFTNPSGGLNYPATSFGATNYWVDVEVEL